MRKVAYIGLKPTKSDNVAGTGLTWQRGQVHDIVDDAKAAKLLEHKNVWVDGSDETKIVLLQAPEPVALPAQVVFTTGRTDQAPIIETVDDQVYAMLQTKALVPVFMSVEDYDQFRAWKLGNTSHAPMERGPHADPHKESAAVRPVQVAAKKGLAA